MSIAGKHFYRFGYLKSEEWHGVRLQVLARDRFICRVCGHIDFSNDAHHCEYPDNIWKTEPKHCITLCRTCHKKIHEIVKGKTSWGIARKAIKLLQLENGNQARWQQNKIKQFEVFGDIDRLIRALQKQIIVQEGLSTKKLPQCWLCGQRSICSEKKVITELFMLCTCCSLKIENLPFQRWGLVKKLKLTVRQTCESNAAVSKNNPSFDTDPVKL